ncbi:ATP phosphoribosyltransferase [Fulvivirga maritima]|uniref:ATP phosphoribosyltransferase n=1 Tax=Fulvivirga maritima TaxID=2904247 RepID=UPI001F485596|nr:ATP phosphoribosyltransferase [Fulvivirga maritima]UII26651.1 ATP phosphoribosyltransferase [Fulvivirga maritima]
MTKKIRIAIQKSGRLQEQSVKLLKECGLSFSNGPNRLKASCYSFPAEILFLRDDDIPQYVEDGVADVGIVGENVYIEKQKEISVIEKLDFSKCRLSIAIPREKEYGGPQSLNGKKIATSYPNIVRQYLKEQNIQADIHEISGSVEIAPGIGLAEAIVDIVSTGSTLLSNGLKEVETVMKSEAILVSTKTLDPEVQILLDKLIFRIKAVNTAKNNKYLLLNTPNESIKAITNILPGMKSPTVTPLQQEGWSSLHSVINENDFWEIIDQLKDLGAQGILVVPIEKMII